MKLAGMSITIEAQNAVPGLSVGPVEVATRLAHDHENQTDIEGLRIDYFWGKCEEFLPRDWLLILNRHEHGEHVAYQAMAILGEDGEIPEYVAEKMHEEWHKNEGPPDDKGPWRVARSQSPERALERLFYMLRDML